MAVLLGAATALLAWRLGSVEGSPFQACMVGGLSACGYFAASTLMQGRVRRRQGETPPLEKGESARLYGPATLQDEQGKAEGWLYLSDRRLIFREAQGQGLELPLREIRELRPLASAFFQKSFEFVAHEQGALRFVVPDAKRWHRALTEALQARS